MEEAINSFLTLSRAFKDYGYHLYLVGGSVRDYLLHLPIKDIDLATDATPNEMKTFLMDADYTFAKFGYVKLKFNGLKFDITTFRKERKYKDFRHPFKIKFIKKMKVDSKRRDFTVNAFYMDDKFNVYDFHHGKKDLQNKIIKTIGNPRRRIKEDPLRIIRAIRFSLMYGFEIDPKLKKAMRKQAKSLLKLTKDKVLAEVKKINNKSLVELVKIFKDYAINFPLL